jgi:hypothetical protein
MATKIITLSYPSIDFTDTIDWYAGDIFKTITFADLTINFLNTVEGKRIIVSLTNSSISPINLNLPINVVGALATIPGNKTQTYSLTRVGSFIYASLESSTDYGVLFTSSGLLTVPAGITTIYATVIPATGGGGGAGMTLSPVPGYLIGGGGGGGGGYKPNSLRNILTIPLNSTLTITIGAAGTAGAGGAVPTPGDGGAGGTTVISLGATSLLSIPGGDGGKHGAHATGQSAGQGGVGGQDGGIDGTTGSYPTGNVGGTGGLGGINPTYNAAKGGTGGSAPNTSGYGSSGGVGTSAIVLITYS